MMKTTARPRTPIDRVALLAALQSINVRLSESGQVSVPGLPGRHPRLFGQLVPDATEANPTPAPSADYAVQIVGQPPEVLSVTAMGVIASGRPDVTKITGYLLPKVLISTLPQWTAGPQWLLDTLPRLRSLNASVRLVAGWRVALRYDQRMGWCVLTILPEVV